MGSPQDSGELKLARKGDKKSEFSRLNPKAKAIAIGWILVCLFVTWLLYWLAFSFWGFDESSESISGGVLLGYLIIFVVPLVVAYALYAYGFREIVSRFGPEGTEVPSVSEEFAKSDITALPADEFMDAYSKALLHVLVHVSLADGKLEVVEVRRIIEIFNDVADAKLEKARLENEIALVQENPDSRSLKEQLTPLLGQISEDGREYILHAAARVMVSDQDIDDSEWTILSKLAFLMDVPDDRLKDIADKEMAAAQEFSPDD